MVCCSPAVEAEVARLLLRQRPAELTADLVAACRYQSWRKNCSVELSCGRSWLSVDCPNP